MRTVRPIALALTALALAACSRMHDPLAMTGERAAYVGTWVSKQSIPAEGKTDNTVLILGENSSGSYMRCMDYRTRSDSGSVSEGHNYRGLRGGTVTALSDRQLTISMPLMDSGLAMNDELEIGGPPYEEGGSWHLKVDGTTLRKLGPDETSDHGQWPCWSDKPADDSPPPGRRT